MLSLQRGGTTGTRSFAARAVQSLLRQLVLRTQHDGAASRDPSAKRNDPG